MPARVFIDGPDSTDSSGPPAVLSPGTRCVLSPEETHYALRVRRLRTGASLEALDGRGGRWRAILLGENPRGTMIEIVETVLLSPHTDEIHLLVGRPDIPACLEVLTGACELPIASVRFVNTRFAQPRDPSPSRVLKTFRAAMRQCGRPLPPSVLPSCDLDQALDEAVECPGIFGAMEGPGTAPGEIRAPCNLLVGPEGGLHDEELTQLRSRGWTGVHLSPWVLRTPTAALALAARTLVSPCP